VFLVCPSTQQLPWQVNDQYCISVNLLVCGVAKCFSLSESSSSDHTRLHHSSLNCLKNVDLYQWYSQVKSSQVKSSQVILWPMVIREIWLGVRHAFRTCDQFFSFFSFSDDKWDLYFWDEYISLILFLRLHQPGGFPPGTRYLTFCLLYTISCQILSAKCTLTLKLKLRFYLKLEMEVKLNVSQTLIFILH
jgi:hypothetical protein